MFQKIKRLAAASRIRLYWCGLSEKLSRRFVVHSLITEGAIFHQSSPAARTTARASSDGHSSSPTGAGGGHGHGHGHGHGSSSAEERSLALPDLDSAVKVVEDALLAHVHDLAQKWLVDPAARKIYIRKMLHDSVRCEQRRCEAGVLLAEPCASRGAASRGAALQSEPCARRGAALQSEPCARRGAALQSEPCARRGAALLCDRGFAGLGPVPIETHPPPAATLAPWMLH